MFKEYNPNPEGKRVGDCVVRAITKVLNESWDEVYMELAELGMKMSDMPTANRVWSALLTNYGYKRYAIENTCPACYLIKDFCMDHTKGKYVLGTGTHAVAVVDGDYYDTWDSGKEVPVFYWSVDE